MYESSDLILCLYTREDMTHIRHVNCFLTTAKLEDHSPDLVTLNETFTKKGYKYNMPHYTAVTRNREDGKGGDVAILLRHDLAYTEIDDI